MAGAAMGLLRLSALRERRPISEICRIPRGGSAEDAEVLLNGNAEAEGKSYWDLGGTAHLTIIASAYATDDKGSELYTVHIRDLATGGPRRRNSRHARKPQCRATAQRCLHQGRRASAAAQRLQPQTGTPISDDARLRRKDSGFFVGSLDPVREVHLIDIHDHETSSSPDRCR